MSRLSAALNRAATGDPGEQPQLEHFQPEQPRLEQTPVEAGPSAKGEEHPSLQSDVTPEMPIVQAAQPGEKAIDDLLPHFTAFHSTHAEKLVVSPAMPREMREHYRR